MNFVQWLNSLDELLYELMSWLVFFPVTLWRLVRHPLGTLRYAEEQLMLDVEQQYRATVSPPIMLILTIVLLQALGLAIGADNTIIANQRGLAGLVNDNTTLLLLRLILFGVFALVLSSLKVLRSGAELNRDTLKPSFYAQCYAIAPFALLLGLGVTMLGHRREWLSALGAATVLVALIFYGVVQIRWFSRELGQSLSRSFVDASVGMVVSLTLTLGLGVLFV